jgi:hypothetical protein
VDWESVLSWRVGRQHLGARAPASAWLDVVSELCGVHAQLMASAELMLWARVDGLDPSLVSRALWEERSLVKTWAMRGTLHLLPAPELPVWVAAQFMLKPRHHGGFGDLLKPAAFRGDLAFAPSDGRAVRFVRPAAWLGPLEDLDRDAAALEVARRYLRAYGPATREAFAPWFGFPSPAAAGRWLRMLGDELAETALGLMLAADVEAASSASPSRVVRLLPAFDQYVVAAPRDVAAVLPAEHRGRVYRPQGWLSPVLLSDGVMAGVWSHEAAGTRLSVSIEPFSPVGRDVVEGAELEAARLAAFLGGELDVSWTAPR